MPNANYNDIFTTTLESRTKKLADNVSDNNALLARLREKGKSSTISGGSKIIQELEYGEGDLVWYGGYDDINYTPKQLFTAAEYQMKLCAVPVSISGEDLLKNSGRERMIDLFKARIANAEKTMKNAMSKAIYSDGTGSDGKEIGGLKLLVADDPSQGIVGGINRAEDAFWRNIAVTGEAITAANIRAKMDSTYLKCSRGSDKPDLIVADDTLYSLYEQSLTPLQRFTNPKMAEAGFETLKFKGADVIFDGGQGGACPANHMYFLNTDYIYLRSHKDRNMKVIGGDRLAVNKDALYKIIGWAGNMTLSNASLQGVLVSA